MTELSNRAAFTKKVLDRGGKLVGSASFDEQKVQTVIDKGAVLIANPHITVGGGVNRHPITATLDMKAVTPEDKIDLGMRLEVDDSTLEEAYAENASFTKLHDERKGVQTNRSENADLPEMPEYRYKDPTSEQIRWQAYINTAVQNAGFASFQEYNLGYSAKSGKVIQDDDKDALFKRIYGSKYWSGNISPLRENFGEFSEYAELKDHSSHFKYYAAIFKGQTGNFIIQAGGG